MGRYYNGDIEGRFWFGIQSSDDISNLVNVKPHVYYTWNVCDCVAEIDYQEYCRNCYETKQNHIDDAINNDKYEDNCLYYEEYTTSYCLDKCTHYTELLVNMNELKMEINDEIIKEFDKIEQNDDILNAFTGVFDKTLKIHNELNKLKENKLSELVARYTLGYQIEYCLRTTGDCNISCEQ
jgi:hypothetical protein